MLLIPAGLYIAIASACTIFIFPQSLSHIVIGDLIKTNMKPIQSILKMQNDVLATAPSDTEKMGELAAKSKKLRSAQAQGTNAVEGQIPMLQLEITRCQIGPGPLTKIFEKTKELGAKMHGLASYVVCPDSPVHPTSGSDNRCSWTSTTRRWVKGRSKIRKRVTGYKSISST